MESVSFAVELGALKEVPVYESHKRGKNWLAVIEKDPTAPGGLKRSFQPSAKGEYHYMINGLSRNDVVEFGADYYTSNGGKRTARWYGVVTDVTEDHIAIAHEAGMTSNQAFKAALSNVDMVPTVSPNTIAREFIEQIASMSLYEPISERDGYSQEQLDDAIDTLNNLIQCAQRMRQVPANA
jgi:hypothetical protein